MDVEEEQQQKRCCSIQLEQPADIAFEDGGTFALRDIERVHGIDGAADQARSAFRVERRIGGKQAVPGREKIVPAAHGGKRAVGGGAGVEQPVEPFFKTARSPGDQNEWLTPSDMPL